jgi:hypothetical protein
MRVFYTAILASSILSIDAPLQALNLSHSEPLFVAKTMRECVVEEYNKGTTIDAAAESCTGDLLSDTISNCATSLMSMGIMNYDAAKLCDRAGIDRGGSIQECTNRLISLGIKQKDAEEFCY